MTATLQPFGLMPSFSPQYNAVAQAYMGGVASGYSSNILKYQPVMLNSSGNIIAATAGSDTSILGSFAGVSWIDSNGVYQESNKWSASMTYGGGTASPNYAWVYNSPIQTFRIQCDATLALSVGGQVDFSNITAGSTTTGLSAATASASSLTTSGQNQLRVLALDPAVNNAWGDAFPIIQVQISQHQFVANVNAV